MTLLEIVRNIRNLINDSSDDYKISDRQLSFIVRYYRAKLIREDLQKGRSISSNIIQSLGVQNIVCLDSAEDCHIRSGIITYRTENSIPKPIEVNDKDLIVYAGSIDGLSNFQFGSKAQARWSKHHKLTADKYRTYLRNGHIYIEGSKPILVKRILVEGVFEDPIEVATLTDCEGTRCYDLDVDNYPISAHILQAMSEMILTKELNIKQQVIEDKQNDANDTNQG